MNVSTGLPGSRRTRKNVNVATTKIVNTNLKILRRIQEPVTRANTDFGFFSSGPSAGSSPVSALATLNLHLR